MDSSSNTIMRTTLQQQNLTFCAKILKFSFKSHFLSKVEWNTFWREASQDGNKGLSQIEAKYVVWCLVVQ